MKNLFVGEHISKLNTIQNEFTLECSNNLSMDYINWRDNKIKDKYAAQILSASTKDVLEFI